LKFQTEVHLQVVSKNSGIIASEMKSLKLKMHKKSGLQTHFSFNCKSILVF